LPQLAGGVARRVRLAPFGFLPQLAGGVPAKPGRGSVLRTQASGSLRSRPPPAFGRTPPGTCGAPPTPGLRPAVPSPTSLLLRGGLSCRSTGKQSLALLWTSPPACWGSGPEGPTGPLWISSPACWGSTGEAGEGVGSSDASLWRTGEMSEWPLWKRPKGGAPRVFSVHSAGAFHQP